MPRLKLFKQGVVAMVLTFGGVWAVAKGAQGRRRKKQREDEERQRKENELVQIRKEASRFEPSLPLCETTGIQDIMEMFVEIKADNGEWVCIESAGMQDIMSHPSSIAQTRKIAQLYNRKARLVDKYGNLYSKCDENGVFWGLSS